MAQSAGKYVRAPRYMETSDSSMELAEQLAEERSLRTALAIELEQSQKENEELRANLNAHDAGSNLDNHNFNFDAQNGLCSTRHLLSYPGTSRNLEESRFLSSMNQLSVASINVPECKASDDEQIHRQTFELWKDLLIDSMKLAGIEDEATMYTLFKVKAGSRLLEIFRNTKSQADAPDSNLTPFSNAMHRLKTYFGSGSDVMLMRRRLTLMVQRVEESDLSFIVRVGSTARLCEYDDDKEFEEIVATVAEHARNRDVRTTALKMLSRKGSFTDLVDKVRELEAIRLNEEYVLQKHVKSENQTHALIAPVRSYQNWEANRSTRGTSWNVRGNPARRSFVHNQRGRGTFTRTYNQPQLNSQSSDRCWRCFSVYHSANICNAKDKICNKCGIVGHIQRACTTSAYKRPAENGLETIPAKIANVEKVEECVSPIDPVSVERED
ncbi:uncharacterized protein LOC131428400 [Malaya genurostris]|uniref:uncharacterized protein LOC131428400 n=1 Tax=Malaya genurostris TaxID=325434 RepID=UPI0026F3BDBF|nr:uncharacterized protein LOC131428400 [Malaya genurostris]